MTKLKKTLLQCGIIVLIISAAIFAAKEYWFVIFHISGEKAVTIGQTLYFHGEISNGDFNIINNAIEKNHIKTIEINSPGGNVDEAIKIGNIIFDKKINISINRICLSSCANYIFTAAKQIYLNKKSIIGWHGGMTSTHIFDDNLGKSIETKKLISTDPDFEIIHKSEIDFFKKIGVQKSIVSCGSNKDAGGVDGMSFYKIKDLNKFGIKNISFTDSGEALWIENSKDRGMLLIDYCQT